MSIFKKIIIGATIVCVISLASAYTPPLNVSKNIDKLRGFSELTSAANGMNIDTYTSNLITWQMSHGGWSKANAANYVKPWDGKAALSNWTGANNVPLGMYDNNATVQEMRLLATRYKAISDATLKKKFKGSFTKGIGFILNSQYSSGGWPQVYPKRGNYSDYVTYNDNAMARVMVLVSDIINKQSPFDTDLVSSGDITKLKDALNKAVDFTLKAQIINNGKSTVWCAQHDPITYAPKGARAYELPSKSGSESVPLVWFLMSWPDQTTAIQNAVKGAIAWYKKTRVSDLKFSSGAFVASAGSSLWYRFYNVEDDSQFFCDRDGVKTYDFMSVSEERRKGYQWGGDYGSSLLAVESDYLNALQTTKAAPKSYNSKIAGKHQVRILPDHLEISIENAGTYQITLTDTRGLIISSLRERSSNGLLEMSLHNIRSNAGFYIVRVSRPDGSTVLAHKFILF